MTQARKSIRVAPSILSADFARLADEIAAVEAAGADVLHLDVMDGRFVPNITIGPLVVEAVRRVAKVPLHVHLMIVEPERYLDDFARAGADLIFVHPEATVHPHRALQAIARLKKRAGIALNPHTPVDLLEYLLDDLASVLVMSVNPGFGGQTFIRSALAKIRAVKTLLDRRGVAATIDIEVDGGVNATTANDAVSAGANVLVAGSWIFGSKSYEYAIESLRSVNVESAQNGV